MLWVRAQAVCDALSQKALEKSMASAEAAFKESDVRSLASIYAAALQNETRLLAKIDAALAEEDVALFERDLAVDDSVAAKVASHELWILARVVGFERADLVKVEDVDDESRLHLIPRKHLLLLPRDPDEIQRARTAFVPPRRVFAMYPETTSFYQAQVVAPAQINTIDDRQEESILVRFQNDENDYGLIPNRPIPIRFLTHLPLQ